MSALMTLGEFVRRAVELGAKERNLADIPGLPPESRQRLSERFLQRQAGPNRRVEVPLPKLSDETELLPKTVVRLCIALQLKPEDFGFTLH